MKVLVLVLLLSAVCSPPLALAWQWQWQTGTDTDDADAGSARPYYYGEESFQRWVDSRQGRFMVLERFADELLAGAVGNYRVAQLEAAPRAFTQPKHYDADVVAFVKRGEGVVVLLRGGGRPGESSFCVRDGDVIVVPAGAVVYSANTHSSEWLRFAMLFIPVVSTSGRFEEFFPIGGESPESFLGVFSDDVIQASFNTSREEWAKVFEKQSKGEITTASEEQIRELSRSCERRSSSSSSEVGDGDSASPSSSSSSSSSKWEWEWADMKPSSLTGKKPTYSNSHGRLYEITGDEIPPLRLLDMEVSLANISRGSLIAPSYNTRAYKIAIVVEVEMATASPRVSGDPSSSSSSSQRRGGGQHNLSRKSHYRQVKSGIREGSVIVVPAGHPATLVAGEDTNLAVLCFGVNANLDEKVFLAGTNSVLQQMDRQAKELAFGADEEEVDRIIGAQRDTAFLRGVSPA